MSYALKAVAAADPAGAEIHAARERDWQSECLLEELKEEIMSRIIIQRREAGFQLR